MRPDMLAQLRTDEADGGRPALYVYDDATGEPVRPGYTLRGHPTIGIGRCLDTRGISPAEAEAMFARDVCETENLLLSTAPSVHGFSDVRRDVLVQMAFQMGVPGLMEFRHMWAAMLRGDWEAAGAAALDSAWAREMAAFGSPRARRLAAQLATGDAAATAAWWQREAAA